MPSTTVNSLPLVGVATPKPGDLVNDLDLISEL
jgi:hypothetical protein